MSAAAALQAARQAGVTIAADGDDLILRAAAPPAAALVEALRRYKPDIIALLTPATSRRASDACAAGEVDGWRAFFDERARMLEHDGRLARDKAERRAFECCISAWLDAHPEPSSPGRCAWCGAAEAAGGTIVPFGTQHHIWLHPECWAAWYQKRRRQAEAALKAFGIAAPAKSPQDFGKIGSA